MNKFTRLTGKETKDKKNSKYCTVYKSLEESLKEVKLIKEGKIKPKTWQEILERIDKNNKIY